MTRFNTSIWDDDDPALRRLRDALDESAQRQIEEMHRKDEPSASFDAPQSLTGPAGRAEEAEGVSHFTPDPAAAPTIPDRRHVIAELVARVQAGDQAAIDELRRLADA